MILFKFTLFEGLSIAWLNVKLRNQLKSRIGIAYKRTFCSHIPLFWPDNQTSLKLISPKLPINSEGTLQQITKYILASEKQGLSTSPPTGSQMCVITYAKHSFSNQARQKAC